MAMVDDIRKARERLAELEKRRDAITGWWLVQLAKHEPALERELLAVSREASELHQTLKQARRELDGTGE